MKHVFVFTFFAAVVLFLGSACNRQVQRIETNSTVDISGRWNDTDARLTAQELITEAMSQPWLTEFTAKNDKRPVVICGMVVNKSHEHIESEPFVKELEKAFLKSGRVRIVQGGDMREQLRRERADQQSNASQETVKAWGLEVGADYILQGTINSIVDAEGRKKVTFYQVDMELTDIQTNEIVWIGDKKIKKYIKN